MYLYYYLISNVTNQESQQAVAQVRMSFMSGQTKCYNIMIYFMAVASC